MFYIRTAYRSRRSPEKAIQRLIPPGADLSTFAQVHTTEVHSQSTSSIDTASFSIHSINLIFPPFSGSVDINTIASGLGYIRTSKLETCHSTLKVINGLGETPLSYIYVYQIVERKHTDKPFKSQSCIRGHRSSKCAHYDRPMKRIPKAGRPLTKCSHLNGVDCNCREVWAIMVPLAPGMSCQRNGIGNFESTQICSNICRFQQGLWFAAQNPRLSRYNSSRSIMLIPRMDDYLGYINGHSCFIKELGK